MNFERTNMATEQVGVQFRRYTAPLKNKNLPKHLPRPHRTPSQAAAAPKLSSQVTFLIFIFFAKQNIFPSATSVQKKKLQQHFFIFFDADRISAVVGGVLLAAREPADPWSRGYKYLELHWIVVDDSLW